MYEDIRKKAREPAGQDYLRPKQASKIADALPVANAPSTSAPMLAGAFRAETDSEASRRHL
jgi:hypothetical protein